MFGAPLGPGVIWKSSAVCDFCVIFLFGGEREMGELCVAAGQVQSGGSHSQPLLSSSAPATDQSTKTELWLRSMLRRREREGIVVLTYTPS